jgi:hypothetical protein
MREKKKGKACRIEISTKVVHRRKGNAKRPIGQRKKFVVRWNGEGERK